MSQMYASNGSAAASPVGLGSASNIAALSASKAVLVANAGQWSVTHAPAAATKATIAKAAGGAGVRHVCTGLSATIACGTTAQTPLTITLYDGTSAGTALGNWTVSAPANGQGGIALQGLCIVGSANTAMTIEFSGAGVTDSKQAVTLSGYSVS